uniref:Uncharacterized protein n=1 Tax=Laticauda laticaudata TaxID=8630 RepID=A0A8C5WUV9_LATLA
SLSNINIACISNVCLLITLFPTGTYLTNEAKGAEDAPDADTAIINAEGSQVNAEEKKEYFI